MVMDAWTFIPFMMIMLLAGLQALPKEVMEAAEVDGANGWQSFWQVTFPLMLPVSITAIVLRIIFKLKLADIVINVTAGGPGGATDSVTSFIFREYRDRSNVGYGTLLGDGLPRVDHRLRHAAARPRQPPHAPGHMKTAALPLQAAAGSRAASHGTHLTGRVLIYGALILWAFVCLFPIYWTVSTSFKTAANVMAGHLLPWVDFEPDWRGWRSLGLSPDTIAETSTVREEFVKRFANSVVSLAQRFVPRGRDRLARRLRPLAASPTASARCATRTSRSSSCRN